MRKVSIACQSWERGGMKWFKLESWHLEFATHSGCLPFEALFRNLSFPSTSCSYALYVDSLYSGGRFSWSSQKVSANSLKEHCLMRSGYSKFGFKLYTSIESSCKYGLNAWCVSSFTWLLIFSTSKRVERILICHPACRMQKESSFYRR
jgi:hypothetical protein